MKKKFMMLLSAVMIASNISMAYAAEPTDEMSMRDETTTYTEVEPRGVDTSGTYSLTVGKSLKKSFKVGNLIKEDHNAFNVKVTVNSGFTTPLIVTITSEDGYYYSKEITSDTTITVKNCDPDDKYTVEFSTNAYDVTEYISGKYNITSYIA